MSTFPVEILFGLYLGLLTGIVPALIAGSLGFLFRYATGVTVPALAVVVLSVAVAGVSGGLLGLIDPTISRSPRLVIAVLVVMMLSLYAHSQGDKLGATFPRRFSLRQLRKQTLSADVVDFVGGIGRVTITPTGEIGDLDGYPPITPDLREQLLAGKWQFPADLPLSELEARLERRLRSEFDLTAVEVTINRQGNATIAAAPPSGGLSRHVTSDQRAASVDTLVPTGIARRDRATVHGEEVEASGTIVSAKSSHGAPTSTGPDDADDEDGDRPQQSAAPTTTGGDGRVTLSVPTARVEDVLALDLATVSVLPRNTPADFELVSTLRRSEKQIRQVSIGVDSVLDGSPVDPGRIRTTHGVTILGINRKFETDGWSFDLDAADRFAVGDDLFVAGPRDAVARFTTVVG